MVLRGKKIGFIGGGAMAEALLGGLLATGLAQAEDLWVSDVSQARLAYLQEKFNLKAAPENYQVVEACQILLLAVKPQVLEGVMAGIRPYLGPHKLVISIVAGFPLAKLESGLGEEVPVIRVMPNTPALIGEGASAYALGNRATEDHGQIAKEILSAVGQALPLEEKYLDAVTGLSGSGPAYVYLFIEALTDAGVLVGLPRDVASSLAVQTVIGSAKMVQKTGKHPMVLKDMVTSPGGTTIAGLQALEKGGLRATLMEAVAAATCRSRELGQD